MKWFKRLMIAILTIGILFMAFYNPEGLNLEGDWEVKYIVLEGRKNYPDNIARYISFPPEIVIDHWSKSILIPIDRNHIELQFNYMEPKNDECKIKLFSKEKSLNGIFDVTVDTIYIHPKAYTVAVEFKSDRSVIAFQKHVIIRPWNPGPIRRGAPY